VPNSSQETKVFPWRIFMRTIVVQLALLLGAIAVSGLLARSFFKERSINQFEEQLESALSIASHGLQTIKPAEWCKYSAEGTHYRVTLLNIDGVVLCDSHHQAAGMENHLDRIEVSDAVGSGRGLAIRHSETLGVDMMYLARVDSKSEQVLRFALPLSDLHASLKGFDRALLIALLVIAVLLALGEVWVAHVFVQPLRSILFRAANALRTQESGLKAADLGRATWGEWENLEGVMENLRRDVKEKMDALRNEKNEQAVIMDSISDALVVIEKSESVVYVNTNFRSLFSEHEDYVGKSIQQFCRDPLVLDAFEATLTSGEQRGASVIAMETRTGRRFFSFSVAPLATENGSTYGAVGAFHDVTDLKLAEQMRIDFIANVSHEIRTPLASIKGYADTALADVNSGSPVNATLLEPIVRNSERMVRLVADLLDLSSLDAGVALEKTNLEAQIISSKVLSAFAKTAASRSQKLLLNETELVLEADEARVEQVLTNLVENACKYTREGGEVTISWHKTDKNVVLEVSDNGAGIEPQHLPRLFERFYRIDKGRSRTLGGTGLGLAIVKHIMMAHGGAVSVESTLGKGTTFRCTFPIT
jgi:two-component system phosphate regulon sensor histidine kinase PhoR